MEFKILSHAGVEVKSNSNQTLVCDPWIVGSSYWRSWWNYPPVERDLINSIKPDVIYLTHIHWDHFHGPSLEKFPKDTLIIVPKGNYSRNRDDLIGLGFTNVKELKHGESYQIAEDFKITSYQFGIFLDSAVVIECNGVRLLNLNDSKHMGLTLKQIVNRHDKFDFVFRSHSSANSRLSYEVVDDPQAVVDDIPRYIKDFASTAIASGAKYAIPFASNHCHLHKDSFRFNKLIQTPMMVKDYFKEHNIQGTELKVMVSGDIWNSETGFQIQENDWYVNHYEKLEAYRDQQSAKLEKFYKEEDRTKINIKVVQKYFKALAAKIPFFLKWKLKNTKFTYVLYCEEKPKYIFNIEATTGEVEQIDAAQVNLSDYKSFPIQIHTTAFIFLRCIGFKIFSHMSIGKRVFYRVTSAAKPKMELLNLIFNLDEYDMIPLTRNFQGRSIETWFLRWREIVLYFALLRDKIFYGKLDFGKYLQPANI